MALAREGTILVVDDDELVRRSVVRNVRHQGYHVLEAATAEEATVLLRQEEIDVVLTDVHLPGMSGLDLVARGPRIRPSTVFLVFTGQGDVATATRCLDLGASDYFEKPIVDWPRFHALLKRSVAFGQLQRENAVLRSGGTLWGSSRAMVDLRARIAQVAPSSASVLVHGESGTGKELVARELHRLSGREGPFMAINCAAIQSGLTESELFGHVKGAHSTAETARAGWLLTADRGTLLLDEIGDMPLELQSKLLRVLEDRTFRPVGGDRELPLTARVIAASHKDLHALAKQGLFRRDLLYRLDVVVIEVPPLREREGDIPLLTYRFVQDIARQEGRVVDRVDPSAMAALEAQSWPGNVRQLRNAVLRAILSCSGGVIRVEDLGLSTPPPEPSGTPAAPPDDPFHAWLDLPYAQAKEQLLEAFSVRYLTRLMEEEGSVTAAADRAGMARPNLSRLLKRYGVPPRS